MKKIRLTLESVQVESFPIATADDKPGTVDAFAVSRAGDTWCITCGEESCACTWDWYCTKGICP